MATRRLVLASGSRYRARVLREAGYEVEIDPPSVDERALDALFAEDAHRLALELAQRKAADVAPRHPDTTVLAGDQVGVLVTPDGARQLTKQPEEEGAVEQLLAMSGTTHRLVNGLVLLRTDLNGAVLRSMGGIDVQEVTMRRFTRDEAVAYVRRFEPYDSAGSYRLEDQDDMAPEERFVVDVRGEDPSGVLGLPLPLLARLLDELDG
jgi:septum formation protein